MQPEQSSSHYRKALAQKKPFGAQPKFEVKDEPMELDPEKPTYSKKHEDMISSTKASMEAGI